MMTEMPGNSIANRRLAMWLMTLHRWFWFATMNRGERWSVPAASQQTGLNPISMIGTESKHLRHWNLVFASYK